MAVLHSACWERGGEAEHDAAAVEGSGAFSSVTLKHGQELAASHEHRLLSGRVGKLLTRWNHQHQSAGMQDEM